MTYNNTTSNVYYGQEYIQFLIVGGILKLIKEYKIIINKRLKHFRSNFNKSEIN